MPFLANLGTSRQFFLAVLGASLTDGGSVSCLARLGDFLAISGKFWYKPEALQKCSFPSGLSPHEVLASFGLCSFPAIRVLVGLGQCGANSSYLIVTHIESREM